jgi:hypothetical protein
MINYAEATLNVGLAIDKLFRFMQKHGHHFPVLYVLNKGTPLNVDECTNSSVISSDSEDASDSHTSNHIYRSAMGFKNVGVEDERNIQLAADKVVELLNPDAIALVIACIYDEFDSTEEIPDRLDNDPEAFKVIHSCVWVREDPEPRVAMIPYTDENVHLSPEVTKSLPSEINCGVARVQYPWMLDPKKIGTKINNPYRSRGSI